MVTEARNGTMKNKPDTIPSLLWMTPFKIGKHKMLLPEIDCLAMAMIYKGKIYGGFVKVDYSNKSVNTIDRVFDFLVRSGKNKIQQLKEKE